MEVAALALLVGFMIGLLVERHMRLAERVAPLPEPASPAPPVPPRKSVDEYVDGLFKPPSTPPGPLLPHQFRMTVGEDWEADLSTMTLSMVRIDKPPLKEPVLYSLKAEPDGTLLMRLADEPRQIAVQNLQLALTEDRRDPRAAPEIVSKIDRLQAAEWQQLPSGIAGPITERYRQYLATRAS